MESESTHNGQGNCWSSKVVVGNPTCTCPLRPGTQERWCFFCHKHDVARGYCTHCPECRACAQKQSALQDEPGQKETLLSIAALVSASIALSET